MNLNDITQGCAGVYLDIHDGIARLKLQRPAQANRLCAATYRAMHDSLQQVKDSHARVLVLTGVGHVFCGGRDEETPLHEVAPNHALTNSHRELLAALCELPIPVVAAVNGLASGEGASLVFACDIVLATKSARFMMDCRTVESAPNEITAWLVTRAIGPTRALAMTLLGDTIDAEQAEAWGLIWRSVASTKSVEAEAMLVAKRLAGMPADSLAFAKKAVRNTLRHELDALVGADMPAKPYAGTDAAPMLS